MTFIRKIVLGLAITLCSLTSAYADITVGNFVYDTSSAWLIGVADGVHLSGDVDVPLYIEIDGKEFNMGLVRSNSLKDCDKVVTFRFLAKGDVNFSFNVFSGCTSLRTIDLPETTKDIDGDIFNGCGSNLESVIIRAPQVVKVDNGTPDKSVLAGATLYVPAELVEEYIAAKGFWSNFKDIKSLDDFEGGSNDNPGGNVEDDEPETDNYEFTFNLERIGGNIYAQMMTFTPQNYSGKVTVPAQVDFDGTFYDVYAINYNCFRGCENITEIEILASENLPLAYSIGEAAFRGCSSLTKVVFPNNIERFYVNFFENCGKFRTAVIDCDPNLRVDNGTEKYGEDPVYPNAALFVNAENYEQFLSTNDWTKVFGRIFPIGHSENVTVKTGNYEIEILKDLTARNIVFGGCRNIQLEEELGTAEDGVFSLNGTTVTVNRPGGMIFNVTPNSASEIKPLAENVTVHHLSLPNGVTVDIPDLENGDSFKVKAPAGASVSGSGFSSKENADGSYTLTVTDPSAMGADVSAGSGQSDVSEDAAVVKNIIVVNGQNFETEGTLDIVNVYNLQGQKVYGGSDRSLTLPAGVYMLVTGNSSLKINVK